jgi:uncharacterized membrane-anchored protein YitT (DUF2179 family)
VSWIAKGISILSGSFILAIGINFFLVPFQLLDGGVIGLALIMNYTLNWKIGFTIILISTPIYLFAWFKNRCYFYNSLHGMLVSSLFIDILYPYHFHFTYYVRLGPMTSSIIGGLLVGTGIGIMLRYRTSTGGTDLLAQILSSVAGINVGVMIFIIDAIVITLGGMYMSMNTFLHSIITISFVGIATSLCTRNLQYH